MKKCFFFKALLLLFFAFETNSYAVPLFTYANLVALPLQDVVPGDYWYAQHRDASMDWFAGSREKVGTQLRESLFQDLLVINSTLPAGPVLELGAWRGFLTVPLGYVASESGRDYWVTDLSARHENEVLNRAPEAHFRILDAQNVDNEDKNGFKPESIAGAFMMDTLSCIPSKAASDFFAGIKKTLVKGGKLVVIQTIGLMPTILADDLREEAKSNYILPMADSAMPFNHKFLKVDKSTATVESSYLNREWLLKFQGLDKRQVPRAVKMHPIFANAIQKGDADFLTFALINFFNSDQLKATPGLSAAFVNILNQIGASYEEVSLLQAYLKLLYKMGKKQGFAVHTRIVLYSAERSEEICGEVDPETWTPDQSPRIENARGFYLITEFTKPFEEDCVP